MRATIALLSLIPLGAHAAETVIVTAEKLRPYVQEHNALVSASQEERAAAEDRQGFFLRSFLPALEVYGGHERFRVGRGASESQPTYGAEARLNLFNGGRDLLEGEVRALETEKLELGGRRVVAEELEKARTLYWESLYLQEKLALLRAALKLNGENLAAAERRIRGGVATQSDRFEFEMKGVELRQDLASAETAFAARKRALALRLGLEPSQSLSLPEILSHEHDYERFLTEEGRDLSPWFREAELHSRQILLSSRQNSRAWWPKLDAFAAYHQYNEREKEFAAAADRTESLVGLRVTMSLPAGFESVREASALSREAKAAELRAGWQEGETRVELENELEELKRLHAQVHEAEENIRRAKRYYELTQSEYQRGVKNSPDVLGAAEKFFVMENKRIEILRDFQVAKSHLLSKMGR